MEPEVRRSVARRNDLLRRGLERLGLQLTSAQHDALDVYLAELQRWAAQVNLTGLRSEEAIVREGFLRSLAYGAAFESALPVKAIDVGSGAGFPGLVLKIGYPNIDMVLLEPRRKRATFLRSIIRRLALTDIRCIEARAEELHEDVEQKGGYDVAFARAVGQVQSVVRMVEPLLKQGGRLILQAGQQTREALPAIRPRLAALGMRAGMLEVPAPDVGLSPTCLFILDKLPPSSHNVSRETSPDRPLGFCR